MRISDWSSDVCSSDLSYPLVEPMLRMDTPEPALLLAVSRQESEFNQFALSSAGARGLMQLMPSTAKHLAKQLKLGYQPAKLTDDAGYNVRLGAFYLTGLLKNWDNNYVLALAGYNAGEARVRSWIRDWGDPRSPNIDVIDRSEEHTSELQSLMRISYAVFCFKKKKKNRITAKNHTCKTFKRIKNTD